MRQGTSLYLDLARFSAAMTVFLGHTAGQLFTGGLLWRFGNYLQTAVMVFFVMSGYVIAHVLAEREMDWLDYAAARFGRIYSIAVPALLLTAVCDYLGLLKSPELYYNGPWGYPHGNQIPQYIATLFLVNRWWIFGSDLEPGINVPFWSMSFEATYYLAIALIIFGRAPYKYAALLVVGVLAGPSIAALAPAWFLGYFAYHLSGRWQISRLMAIGLLAGGAILILASPWIRTFEFAIPGIERKMLLADYCDALGFTAHLLGVNALQRYAQIVLLPIQRVVRFLGGLTFALYLFHRPLIQVLAAYPVGEPSSWQQRTWVIGGTLAVIVTIGRACELQKRPYRRMFIRCVAALKIKREHAAN